ncbi:hypothetical protein BGZ63DRAFT_374447 [Mariannaea sp. PMI_226]|nr:hypothetical protein BGZ63DRAFT_374447 [Mariannaea sp. PMI_226]
MPLTTPPPVWLPARNRWEQSWNLWTWVASHPLIGSLVASSAATSFRISPPLQSCSDHLILLELALPFLPVCLALPRETRERVQCAIMSADLFAEFSDLSNNPPPPSAKPQSQPQSYRPPQHPLQTASPKEPFDLFSTGGYGSTVTSPPTQTTSSWSILQPQSSGTSSWSNFSTPPAPVALSQPPVVADEDDDGWGDFEVAHPSTGAVAPAQAQAQVQTQTQTHTIATSVSSPIAWQNLSQTTAPLSNTPSSINWQGQVHAAPSVSGIPSSIAWPSTSTAPVLAPKPAISQGEPVNNRVRASTLDLISNHLVDAGPSQQQLRPKSTQQPDAQQDRKPAQQTLHSAVPPLRVRPKLRTGPSDPSVLFDAEDFELQVAEGDEEEDNDEFGDFETVAPAPTSNPTPSNPGPMMTSPPPPSMDLLSLGDPVPVAPPASRNKAPPSQLLGSLAFGSTTNNYPQPPKSPSFQDRNPFPNLVVKTPTGSAPTSDNLRSASPVTAWPTYVEDTVGAKQEPYNDDDGWGAWDDFPTKDKTKPEPKPEKKSEKKSENKPQSVPDIDSTMPPENWDWDTADNITSSRSELSDDVPPPINVPPPSVILSVFPELLNTGDALFKPISSKSVSIKQRILSDPKAIDFVEGYILLATTAARVIAGRKQRWHRDKILAKSMSISAAGSKGMKLAGVDKTQSAREDREAADVVAVWRGQVGRLRSAVAAAKTAGKGPTLRVPEISENMQIQTAKMVPTAPKPCVICGLKREERVAKVDYEVEDSFGEWWVEHWGHKACKNFWVQHEKMLRQR